MPYKTSIKKWALMVSKFEPTEQIFKLVHNLNRRFETNKSPLEDFVVFYETPSPAFMPILFPIMQMAEAWSYDGALIATNLQLAERMLKFPGPKKRLYYMWDLEWMTNVDSTPKSYEVLRQIYRNSHLTLLTRAPVHHKIVEQAWGADSQIIDDFNMEELSKAALSG